MFDGDLLLVFDLAADGLLPWISCIDESEFILLLVGLSGGWELHISVVSMPFPDIESHQIFQLPIIQTPDKILSGASKMCYF